MRFLHTADWQLGKPFGRFDAEVRTALSEARFDAIDRIGEATAARQIGHVIVAGDIFDTEGPEDRVIVQAVSRMQRYPCRWWLLPGNHDYARNGGLWDRVRGKVPDSIVLLTEPVAQEMEAGVWLLPAPLLHRHHLDDPTELFESMETPGAKLRIGLAHGSIRDFTARGETRNQIAPDRAKRSTLDFLALGDWHGTLEVGPRTWYAGTPETDRFQRDEPGHVLAVDVAPGSSPTVEAVRTGRFQWLSRDWTLQDAAAFAAECDALLGAIDPAATLLRLSLAGITSLGDRIEILTRVDDDLRHRLRFLDLRADDLVGRPGEQELAELNVEGLLGVAAKKLEEAIEAGGAEALRARRALERLFVEYHRGGQA